MRAPRRLRIIAARTTAQRGRAVTLGVIRGPCLHSSVTWALGLSAHHLWSQSDAEDRIVPSAGEVSLH